MSLLQESHGDGKGKLLPFHYICALPFRLAYVFRCIFVQASELVRTQGSWSIFHSRKNYCTGNESKSREWFYRYKAIISNHCSFFLLAKPPMKLKHPFFCRRNHWLFFYTFIMQHWIMRYIPRNSSIQIQFHRKQVLCLYCYSQKWLSVCLDSRGEYFLFDLVFIKKIN